MKKAKTPNDVWGRKNNCVKYQMCPLCYGCRRYSTNDPDCEVCKREPKKNICDTNKHRADLIEKFISKNVIKIDKVNFK